MPGLTEPSWRSARVGVDDAAVFRRKRLAQLYSLPPLIKRRGKQSRQQQVLGRKLKDPGSTPGRADIFANFFFSLQITRRLMWLKWGLSLILGVSPSVLATRVLIGSFLESVFDSGLCLLPSPTLHVTQHASTTTQSPHHIFNSIPSPKSRWDRKRGQRLEEIWYCWQ